MKQVVIVGGGVIGLFCAVRLAQGGARVTLLEAEGEHASVFGPAASAAAAGMLSPFGEAPSPHVGVALESYDLWQRMQAGAEWADGVRFDGGIVLARDEAGASAQMHDVSAAGRAVTALSASQFRKRSGFQSKHAHGLFIEDEGIADPLRVLSGLAMQARAHGVIIEYARDASKVSAGQVETHEGPVYEADVVLLAPGPWATTALKAAAPALAQVRPAKGHLVSVKLEQALSANVRAHGFYLAQRREDVVLGATMEFDRTDRRVDPACVAELLAAAKAELPGEVKPIGRAWAGIRPMSPDGWPMIGRSGHVLVACGHSRNGWLLAPVTAEIITAYVFGAEIPAAWAALSPERFGSL